MKKPLMLIPPAQAEALYDAALENAPRGRSPAGIAVRDRWADDWAEDDFVLPQPGPAMSSAHDRHSSSNSSR